MKNWVNVATIVQV